MKPIRTVHLLFLIIFFNLNFIFFDLASCEELSDNLLIPSKMGINGLLKKKEDIDYIVQLVSASSEQKKQNYTTPLLSNQSISNYCITTGSTLFLKESLLDNTTPSVWSQMKFPSEKWRTSVFLSYLKKIQSRFSNKNSTDDYYSIDYNTILANLTSFNEADLKNITSESIKILNENNQISNVFLSRFNTQIELDKNSKNDYLANFSGFVFGNYLCSELLSSEDDKSACSKATSWIISSSTPTEKQIVFHSLWKKLITDQKVIEVYSKIAVKILSRIQEKNINNAFWFDDIYSEFINNGYSQPMADQMTWDTIALLSSGGGNTYRKLAVLGVGNIYLEHILFILSNGPLVLDTIYQEKNISKLYSYPRNVNITCDTGKSYTFWSSAYFSKELKKASYTSLQAVSAVYSVQKIYQFGFNDGGRDNSLPFKVDQFDNYNNRIRQDLIMASVGAYYGVTPDLNFSNKDFESTFRNIFSNSEKIQLNPAEETVSIKKPLAALKKYKDWLKLFAPNSPILFLKEKIK